MKKLLFIAIPLALMACKENHQTKQLVQFQVNHTQPSIEQPSIHVALLLDTSNSMDGLIDQAKAQLWSMVNELSHAKYKDLKPSLKIAIYEYGNDNLSERNGYIRQVMPFNSDLDDISSKLFSLTTNGGNEFCGQVISASTKELDWGNANNDLNLIFIAGNEPFTQGPTPFQQASLYAKEKKITVNTIFCGDYQEGINSYWKEGADLTHGTYMAINQNSQTHYVSTPFDDDILILNEKLNDTYVTYGEKGQEKKQMQYEQDDQAASLGKTNAVTRSISKSSYLYNNSTWDLVDAVKNQTIDLQNLNKENLPSELKTKSKVEIETYLKNKSEERTQINKEIQSINQKRMEYLKSHQEENTTELQSAMINSIKKQAELKNYLWENQ